MIISLYTARLVLKILGFSDYGIYNVVGGLVSLFTFINTSMTTSTSRFLSYAIGKGDITEISDIFSSAFFLHICLSVGVLLLCETIGVWYMLYCMELPVERIHVSMYVFQFSIINALFVICSVPFTSVIVANEHMNIYAYLSIIDILVKLSIVMLLKYVVYDKLFIYSFLNCVLGIIMFLIYSGYCLRQGLISNIRPRYSEKCSKMLSFGGWTLFSSLVGMGATQGVNLALNAFFGTIVSAAYGISNQIRGVISNFSSGFQMALNPQIIKSYARGDLYRYHELMMSSAKYSFFLLWIVILPLYLNIDRLLTMWLGNYPENTSIFLRIVLLQSFVGAFSNPFSVSVEATGKIKKVTCIGSIVKAFMLPVIIFVLKFTMLPYMAFVVTFFFSLISLLILIIYSHEISRFSYMDLWVSTIRPILCSASSAGVICTILCIIMRQDSFLMTFVRVLILTLVNVSIVAFIGLNGIERRWVVDLIKEKSNAIFN